MTKTENEIATRSTTATAAPTMNGKSEIATVSTNSKATIVRAVKTSFESAKGVAINEIWIRRSIRIPVTRAMARASEKSVAAKTDAIANTAVRVES